MRVLWLIFAAFLFGSAAAECMNQAAAQTKTPTPVQTKTKPAYDPNAPAPEQVQMPKAYRGGYKVFTGAKSCVQMEGFLKCDNGYEMKVR